MKSIFTGIIFSALLIGFGSPEKKDSDQQMIRELSWMVESQDFYKLKKNYGLIKEKLSEAQSSYFKVKISPVFNKTELSNQTIIQLVANEDSNVRGMNL